MLRRLGIALSILAIALGLDSAGFASAAPADAPARVLDDAALARAVARARAAFLRTQPIDRFVVTVLLRDARDPTLWRRGAYGGDRLAYPASCVKLGFLVGAVHWCSAQGRAPECLDADVRPMIADSDNDASGRVVDAVSGVGNVPDAMDDAAFAGWLQRRRYTETVLQSYDVLRGQRLLTKTYPTNSGEEPLGFEQRALREHGRNAMSANGAAELMLGIVSGRIEPQARDYMRSLLRRERFTAQGSLASGLPAGSIVENKIGVAFDTLEDIAWVRLANGRELIIAAFSNGWDQREPEPWDVLRLGGFTEALLVQAHLRHGLQRQRVLRAPTPAYASVRVPVAESGRFELAVWYEAGSENTSQARFRVDDGHTPTDHVFDQRTWGGRWLPLGVFDLRRGAKASVTLTAEAPGRLAPARIRVGAVVPGG